MELPKRPVKSTRRMSSKTRQGSSQNLAPAKLALTAKDAQFGANQLVGLLKDADKFGKKRNPSQVMPLSCVSRRVSRLTDILKPHPDNVPPQQHSIARSLAPH